MPEGFADHGVFKDKLIHGPARLNRVRELEQDLRMIEQWPLRTEF